MSEEDIKILEIATGKREGLHVYQNQLKEAVENILLDYKQQFKENEANKKRIEELEEENKIYRRQLNSAFDRGFIHKDKIKEIVDECIPVGKNIITGEEEYQPNANANSYLTQTILELLKDGGE